jgi:predicted ATP-grasp superfamily ATP-dependent carboligase
MKRAPALLLVADYLGTLAAARALGRAEIPVTIADWRRFVPARYSRFATHRVQCPSLTDGSDRFIEWLLDFGTRNPGYVLLPTTDDVVWLIARHAHALSRHFRFEEVALETVDTLLNKWKLAEACAAWGLSTPRTTLAGDDQPVAFPVLIKPQTQVLFQTHHKGTLVTHADHLERELIRFRSTMHYDPALLLFDRRAAIPMLQEYVDVQERGIYSLSGYVDDEHFVIQAERKVLQKPLRAGVGLCFEAAAVDPALAERIGQLARYLGYRGVFEIEFLEHQGRALLIDFNPRFFGQMGLDIARGADLPLLAYLSATKDQRRLRAVVSAARSALKALPKAWCDRINLELYLRALRVAGAHGTSETAHWRRWLKERPHDAVLDAHDPWPALVAASRGLWGNLAHPRSTLRAATAP